MNNRKIRNEIGQILTDMADSKNPDPEALKHQLQQWHDQLVEDETSVSDNLFLLQERMKELKCLYDVIACLQTSHLYPDMGKALQEAIEVIPAGFRIPESTEVQIKIGSEVYKTSPFKPSESDLVSTLELEDGNTFELRISLQKENNPWFLKEEEMLAGKLAKLFERFYNHYLAVSEVAEREEMLRITLYSIGDAVITTDARGRIRRMNKEAEKLTGWKEKEADGLPAEKVFRIINDKSRKTVTDPVKKVLEHGRVVGLANHSLLISRNGVEIPISDSGAPIRTKDGGIAGVVLVFRDVSSRKKAVEKLRESESRYRNLFENTHTIMFIINPENGSIVDVNPAAEQFYGWTRKEMQSMNLADFSVLPENEMKDEIGDVLKKGMTTLRVQHQLKDGSVRDLDVYTGPITINGRDLLYSIVIDTTDRLRYETMVRENLKEKEVLLSEVHHRVKNNMAVISGLIQLEVESAQHQELKEIFRKTESRIKSMALVHEKLYQSESFSEIDFGTYVKNLAGHIHSYFEDQRRKVELVFDVEPVQLEISRAVPCGIILNELITNGFKYACGKDDKGKIDLALKEDQNEIFIRYRDYGSGFEENILENFKSGKLKSMGFQLINGLVRQIRGEIDLKNENGAVVEIRFGR